MEPETLNAFMGFRMNWALIRDDLFCEAIRMRNKPIDSFVPMLKQNVLRHEELIIDEHKMGDYEGCFMVDNVLPIDCFWFGSNQCSLSI